MKLLNFSQYQKLLNHVKNSITPEDFLIHLLLETGVRISEALMLQLSDLTGTTLRIRPLKGSATRHVTISHRLASKFRRYVRTEVLGKAICSSNLASSQRKAASRICSYVGAEVLEIKLSPHMIRHSVFTFMYLETRDLLLVQKWAGHKSINSTLHYMHCELNEQANKAWGKIINGG